MRGYFLKSLFSTACLIAVCSFVSAQSFEGIIEFKKNTISDTISYRYYIKGNQIRIDDMGSKGKLTGTMLVDTKTNKVIALSPERKLYMDVENSTKPGPAGTPEVTKTTNTKKIAGYDCKQWRIKNKDENTEVSYWVAEGHFDFFIPLLKTLNRKDKMATYFLMVPDNGGVFPFEASERTLVRQEKGSLVTTKVEKKAIDAKLFDIPKDYQKYTK